jgi:hypothetical protein
LTSPLHISASNNHHAQAKLNFTGARNVTINSLLADSNASFSQSFQSAGTFGIFSGQYMYVYSTCDGADSLGYGVSVIFIDSALADLGNVN